MFEQQETSRQQATEMIFDELIDGHGLAKGDSATTKSMEGSETGNTKKEDEER